MSCILQELELQFLAIVEGYCGFFMRPGQTIQIKAGQTMRAKARVVRICLIATIRDMKAERHFLRKAVFPRLQDICREHDIILEISDPHYGAAEDFDVRATYHHEIDKSQIIIAFLGEHYGWIPENSDMSFLHEEIDYGILNAPETKQLCCKFYLRNLRSSLEVPIDIWTEYWEDEDTERYNKLQQLKEQICQSGIQQYEYSALWGEGKPEWDPNAVWHFHGFEELGERIFQDLWKMIQKVVPTTKDGHLQSDPNTVQIPFLEESVFQESFRNSLTQLFVGQNTLLQDLDNFVTKKSEGYLVLTGNSGLGKSSTLAKFAEKLRSLKNHAPLVLTHNIGLTGQSRDVRCILEWLCKELHTFLSMENTYAKDLDTLRNIFSQVLEQVAEKNKVVIILDGINELYPRYQAYQFYWLPTHIPNNVQIILSLTDNTYEAELRRRFRCEHLTISPLTIEERRLLLNDYCALYELELPENCREDILCKSGSAFPLYLKLATEEVNAKAHGIAPIPMIESVQKLPDTLPALIGLVLDNWEKEFGYEIVASFLGALAIAQNSLPLPRLRTLIQTASQQYLSTHLWSPLTRALSPYLFEVQQQVQLSHEMIEEAVYNRYLILDTERVKNHQRFAEFLERQGYALAVTVSELPYHWLRAKNWSKLLRLLTNIQFWEAKANAHMINELCQDIALALQEVPRDITVTLDDTPDSISIGSVQLEILQRALQMDLAFLTQTTQEVFSCIWNRCYWYDCPLASKHYAYQEVKGKKLPWTSPVIYPLMEKWREYKTSQHTIWMRSRRPLEPHLDSPLQHIFYANLGISDVSYSKDGKKIAASSWDTCIRIWDLASSSCLSILKGHTQWVESVEFSKTSTEVATCSRDKTIRIWDVESGTCLKTFKGHMNWVMSISYSSDNKRLASASADETVKIWEVGSGQCLKTLKGHKGTVTHVACHPKEDFVASASQDHTIRIWDMNTGNCIKILKGHTDSIEKIAFSSDGKYIASAGFDHTIRIWNAVPDSSTAPGSIGGWFKESVLKSNADCLKIIQGHDQKVTSIAFSPDGRRVLSGSWDKTVRLWQIDTGECLLILRGHDDCVTAAEFSPDSRYIASSAQDKTVRIWELDLGKTVLSLQGHHQNVYAVSLDTTGTMLATASEDKTIGIWNIESGICEHTLKGHEDAVLDLAFHPQEPIIVTVSQDKSIRMWDIQTKQCKKVISGHTDWVRCIAFSPNGEYFATGSSDKTMRIWSKSGVSQKICTGHTDYIRTIAWSNDGNYIASAGEDKTCRVYQANGELWKTLLGHESSITKIEFSRDDRLLIVFGETNVKIWELDTGNCIKTIPLSNGFEIASICQHLYAFSKDGVTFWKPLQEKPLCHYYEELEKASFAFYHLVACGRNNRNYTYIFKLES